MKYEHEVARAQARWLELSSNANNQIFTPSQLEYIDFDEPETLINAVREVYDQARSAAAKNRNETNACAHDRTARRYDAANS